MPQAQKIPRRYQHFVAAADQCAVDAGRVDNGVCLRLLREVYLAQCLAPADGGIQIGQSFPESGIF